MSTAPPVRYPLHFQTVTTLIWKSHGVMECTPCRIFWWTQTRLDIWLSHVCFWCAGGEWLPLQSKSLATPLLMYWTTYIYNVLCNLQICGNPFDCTKLRMLRTSITVSHWISWRIFLLHRVNICCWLVRVYQVCPPLTSDEKGESYSKVAGKKKGLQISRRDYSQRHQTSARRLQWWKISYF